MKNKIKLGVFVLLIGALIISGRIYLNGNKNTVAIKHAEVGTKVSENIRAGISSNSQIDRKIPLLPTQSKAMPEQKEKLDLEQRIHPTFARLIRKDNVIASRDGAIRNDGTFQRTTLVRTSMKYPLVKVIQDIRQDIGSEEGNVVHESALVADHVMVTLKDGQSQEDLQYTVSKMGGNIRKFLPNSNVYLVSFEVGDNLDSLDRFQKDLGAQKDVIKVINKDYLGHI